MFTILATIAGIWALYRVDARDWQQAAILGVLCLVFAITARLLPDDG